MLDALFDLVVVELLEAVETELFDAEGGDDAAVYHRLADGFGIGLSRGGERAHEAAGEGVAGAGGIGEGFKGVGV